MDTDFDARWARAAALEAREKSSSLLLVTLGPGPGLGPLRGGAIPGSAILEVEPIPSSLLFRKTSDDALRSADCLKKDTSFEPRLRAICDRLKSTSDSGAGL